MKLTKSKLKQLIKEEIQNVLNEQTFRDASRFAPKPAADRRDLGIALYKIQSAGECLGLNPESHLDNSPAGWRGCIGRSQIKFLRRALNIIEKHMAVQK